MKAPGRHPPAANAGPAGDHGGASPGERAWEPERLIPWLTDAPTGATVWVAFSGGLDSTALLHGASRAAGAVGTRLAAVHVHHGLHPRADAWAEHCRGECATLGVPLRIARVDARPGRRQSPEDAARRARYAALGEVLGRGDVALTAHTRDDQAETVLLALLRGSGPAGLAAMPPRAHLGRGALWRPLLDVPRRALAAFVRGLGAPWLEDPANTALHLERNRIRHQVLPLLREMREGADAALSRAARLQAGAARLLGQLGEADLDAALDGDGALPAAALPGDPDRAANLVRTWVRRRGLPVPTAAQLEQVLRVMADAAPGRAPLVEWPGAEIRRYRGRLWLMRPLSPPPAVDCRWTPPAPLRLAHGVLYARTVSGAGIRWQHGDGPLRVRLRAGGERCGEPGRPGRSLKGLYQEHGVPPWLRPRTPLVYAGERLVAVAGIAACGAAAQGGEQGLWIGWRDDALAENGETSDIDEPV